MVNRELLPHVIAGIALALFIVLELASATQQPPTAANPYRPLRDVPGAVEIGTVQTDFVSTYASANILRLNVAAHAALLERGLQEHGDNIDVVNITWTHVGRIAGARAFRYSAEGMAVRIRHHTSEYPGVGLWFREGANSKLWTGSMEFLIGRGIPPMWSLFAMPYGTFLCLVIGQ